MGSLVRDILLQSLVAPFLLAVLVLLAARLLGSERLSRYAPACAILLAVGTTYILAFGWPTNLMLNARSKIMLSAFIGFAAGMAIGHHHRGSAYALMIGTISLPIWIGLPALQQARPDVALLLLPIAAGLIAPKLVTETRTSDHPSGSLISLALALGLAAIAALGKAVSLAELSLALASALFAILIAGKRATSTPSPVTRMAAAALILTLTSALLLYSNASLPALAVLSLALGAERFARLGRKTENTAPSALRVSLYSFLPMSLAILIARIDAGPISIY